MLKIEVYPLLDGVMVRLIGVDHSEIGRLSGNSAAAVTRRIPTATVEGIGLDEALRDVIVDVVTEYPGMLSYALK